MIFEPRRTLMFMDYYTPLFSKIVESSLWEEPDFVVKVFLTMLALKDRDWVVRKNEYNLAFYSRKSIEEVKKALQVLADPDKIRPGQPNDGRRIKRQDDGWLIINGAYYQSQMQRINARVKNAEKQKRHRAKSQNGVSAEFMDRERRFVKAQENGDQGACDRIAAEGL